MKTVKKVLIDMIPVVLGILIALFINDWKQNSENQRFLTKVLSSIDKEMNINIEQFNHVLPKQRALIDTVERYIDSNEVSISELFDKTRGLQIPTVKNTSWKSFLNSKIELVDFEVISYLTDIDESKEIMGKKIDGLMDFVLNNSESTEKGAKNSLINQLLNLLDTEEQLLYGYKEYLELEKGVDS